MAAFWLGRVVNFWRDDFSNTWIEEIVGDDAEAA
jgi:hypothetical protein